MKVTDEMVSRFLTWRLPENFAPDAGISFKRIYNEASPYGPSVHEPTGTNLLNAQQARAMLEHVLAGAQQAPALVAESAIAARLLALADELDAELDSGAKWTKAQHTCASVSGALRDLAPRAAEGEETIKQLVRALREEVEGDTFMGEPVLPIHAQQSPDLTTEVAAALERKIVAAAIEECRQLSADKDLTLGAKGSAFWGGWESALDEVEARIEDDRAKLPALAAPPVAPPAP